MEKFNSMSRHDIQQVLTDNQVTISRIISMAMLAGPLVFFLLIYVMNSNKQPLIGEALVSETTRILIFALIILGIVMYGVFLGLPKIFLSAKALKNRLELFPAGMPNSRKAEFLIGIDRTLMIIRFAMLEGVAMFAVVVLFLELTNSPWQIAGDMWLMATPLLILFVYTLYNFPSKEKMLLRIENELLNKVKNLNG